MEYNCQLRHRLSSCTLPVLIAAFGVSVLSAWGVEALRPKDLIAIPGVELIKSEETPAYKTLADVPPIEYIRKSIPQAKVPAAL